MSRALWMRWWWLIGLLLVGCGAGATAPAASHTGEVELSQVFPDDGAVEGWVRDGEVELFDEATLFDLVNGQADAFFAYNFQQVAVQPYARDDGVNLRIEVWALASPVDAYGLFTRNAAGEPAPVGNNGDADLGRRLAFWQDRYYAQIRAREPIPHEALLRFGEAIAASLPEGGAPPALVAQLPEDGQIPRSVIVFRKEISIQDEIWLGGENVLNLTGETMGVLAAYEVSGARAWLLVVHYPDGSASASALAQLEAAQVDGLVEAGVAENLLGAVLGEVDPAAAKALLQALFSE